MTRIQRLCALFVSLLAVALAMVAVSSPAQAAVPINCPDISMCGYNQTQFQTGGGYEINPTRSSGVCENVTFNDQWSSIFNRSGKTVRFFKNANCGGGSYILVNGGRTEFMNVSHPTFNDEISSFRWGG